MRVEHSMRGEIRAAVQKSSAYMRKTRQEEEKLSGQKHSERPKITKSSEGKSLKNTDVENPKRSSKESTEAQNPPEKLTSSRSRDKDKPTDFATIITSAPRRLNDIVQAPPEIKKLPRGATKLKTARGEEGSKQTLQEGVLSMARKAMLEEERERAVRMYREMKKHSSVVGV